ncbi:hypothetical protein DF185_03930 [Marinifilum breve]|uniref:Uncharacterized protein n=1 Tax=Marinifilum breve TaxID=2184082 RepID=A0A2V4A3S2_9BACT|nr:hypothetical protein DF185_03930 [Marinifilum breve]
MSESSIKFLFSELPLKAYVNKVVFDFSKIEIFIEFNKSKTSVNIRHFRLRKPKACFKKDFLI